jgi:GcrA cell cycle regulator
METRTMVWNDERIDLLKKLWAEGLSASGIASRLGDVSRNAVIGKVHRLGLPGRRPTSRSNKARTSTKKERTTQPSPARPVRRPTCSVQDALALRLVKETKPAPKPRLVIIPQPEKEFEIAAGVKLLDLNEHMCRWPEGDPKASDFYFCGRRSAEGLSYCAHHARLAFKPMFWRQNRERQKGYSLKTLK